MNDGQRVFSTPAGIELGPLDLIDPRGARSFVVQLRAGRFHGFVVRQGEAVYGYVDRCPHMGLPLAKTLDDYFAGPAGPIACSWHGALFAIETGRCVAGPCLGAQLARWPVHVVSGRILTDVPGQLG